MTRWKRAVNAITKDKRINDLSSASSKLAFTWLIMQADSNGRTYGDPALVQSMVFPRSAVPSAYMEQYIKEWAACDLIDWYENDGEKWIQFRPPIWDDRTKKHWQTVRLEILDRDCFTCQYCGGVATHVDHVIPVCQGGTSDPDNLVAACQRCNLKKSGKTPQEAGMKLPEAE